MTLGIELSYRGIVRAVTAVVAIVMVVYHMWAIGFGSPEAVYFRGIHLMFAMVLTFLIFRFSGAVDDRPSVPDGVLLAFGIAPILYLFVNYDYVVNRIFYVDELTIADQIMGVILIVLLLEAVRRVLGWALPITSAVFLIYGLFIAKIEPQRLLDQSSSYDGMKKLNPGYTLATVKKGSYPGQDKDVKVIAYATHIFVSCKLPADEVYKMTKAIVDNTKNLASIAKAIGEQKVADYAEDIGVPFHPGAAKYFKENGVTVKTN
jgi:hypothetical protein